MEHNCFSAPLFLVKTLLLMLMPFAAAASGDETSGSVYPHTETRTRSRSFPATAQPTVEIVNKYGDIQIRNWEKDSVRFEVQITAESDDREYMDLLLEMADVRFASNGSSIRAELLWGENVSAFKRSSVDVTLNVSKNHKLQISYVVFVPEKTNLKIDNRFGDVEVGDIGGKLYATLFHGDLRAKRIADARSVTVKYGRVDAEEIGEGYFDLSFGDMNIMKAQQLRIESSGSEIALEEVHQLDLRSVNDKLDLEKVYTLSGTSSMSDIRIRTLVLSADFSCKFGDFIVRKTEKHFQSINLSGASGDVRIGFENGAVFSYDLQLENSKGFSFPPAVVTVEQDETLDKKRMISGYFAKADQAVKVRISMRAVSVRFENVP